MRGVIAKWCGCWVSALLLLAAEGLYGQGAVGNSCDFVVPFAATAYENNMTVYMCAGSRAANVTVTYYIDLTVSEEVYHIPANGAVKLPLVNRDMMLPETEPGRDYSYKRTLRIHSDVPISAYAHYPYASASGGTNLIPVRSWGYFYNILDVPYDVKPGITITAAYDNTKIEIVPARTTAPTHPAGQPYVITMNKNEAFQVRLPGEGGGVVKEVTGSTVRSIPNESGITYPVSVTVNALSCVLKAGDYEGGSADFELEQENATCRWGKKYITAPFFNADQDLPTEQTMYTLYRIMVRNPATVVKRNGVAMTGLVNNRYYEYVTDKADYIEADEPVMMVQCMLTPKDAKYPIDYNGDGEMIMLSPMEDTGRRADFYIPPDEDIDYNYVTVIVPDGGLPSLRIDGSNSFTYTYPHPQKPGYTVVLKRWDIPQDRYCNVLCDTFFTGMVYALPKRKALAAQSIGFNINPSTYTEGDAMITGKGSDGLMQNFRCVNDSFRLVIKTEYIPQKIEWMLKGYPGLFPNNDNVVVNNPVPDSTVMRDGHTYRYFSLPMYHVFQKPGVYAIPVTVTSSMAPYCGNTQTYITEITALTSPVADFTYTATACLPFTVKLNAAQVPGDTSVITAWNWNLGDKVQATAAAENIYTTEGDKSITLRVTARNGCGDDTVKVIRLKDAIKPNADFQLPAVVCMPYDSARFVNKSTYTGTAPGGMSWQWNFGDASAISTIKDAVHHYNATQPYKVRLIATVSDGCSDTTTLDFATLVNRPKAGFEQSATELCVGSDVTLTDKSVPAAGSSIAQWQWLMGDGGGIISGLNITRRYSRPGNPFTISHFVISREGCRSDTATATIRVYDVPKAEAGPDKELVEGNRTQLDATVLVNGSATIVWSPPAGLSATNIERPYASPKADQLYYLTVTSGICSAYDSVWIKVLPDLKVPNAFTPNNDGNHDRWEIPGLNTYSGAMVQVFNRWGQKVFESKGYPVAWDGTAQGQPLPSGTYYYIIRPGGNKQPLNGVLTIIR